MSSRASPSEQPPPLVARDDALFLDVDGTLLELEATPSAVRADAPLQDLLARLHETRAGALALVSGRSVADIDRIMAPHRFPAAGQHGLEWRRPDGTLRHHPVPPIPEHIPRALAAYADVHPGTLFEAKGASWALHFRQRPELGRAAAALVAELGEAAGDAWEVLQGKMMSELRPAGIHKGIGIGRLREDPPFAGRRPVFVGDDWTDEDGFRVVNDAGGISVAVAVDRDTAARYRLGGVAEVRQWLERALAAPPHRPPDHIPER